MSRVSKAQILVVDDEQSVRDTLAQLLNAAGYDVSTAQNVFDALLQLRRATPDLIISDLNMPQMSGFEFLSDVRRLFLIFQSWPSVALTNPAIRFPAE